MSPIRVVTRSPGRDAAVRELVASGQFGIGLAADSFAERGLLFRPDTQRAVLVKAFVAELLCARNRRGT